MEVIWKREIYFNIYLYNWIKITGWIIPVNLGAKLCFAEGMSGAIIYPWIKRTLLFLSLNFKVFILTP